MFGLICPKCGSNNVEILTVMNLASDPMYACHNCFYRWNRETSDARSILDRLDLAIRRGKEYQEEYDSLVDASQRQMCKICGRPDYFNFYVPDPVWEAIVPEDHQQHAVCLTCFDRLARERGVTYTIDQLGFAGDQMTFQFVCVNRVVSSQE